MGLGFKHDLDSYEIQKNLKTKIHLILNISLPENYMHIWKNTKDISIVLFASIIATLFLYFVLRGPVELNFNSSLLYKENYGKSSDSIVIVKVDNQTLDALQKTDIRVLNLTKTVFSKAIDRLEESGVKAIGIDIIFANLAMDADVLADTLKKYKNVVIAAKVGNPSVGEERILPIDAYSGATWGSIDTKNDGNIVTKLRLRYDLPDRAIETLSVATYRKYIDNHDIGNFEDGQYRINPIRQIPVDSEGNSLIRFSHPPEGYPSYSLIDVLDGKIDPKVFEGKVVLIGEYGTLIHDSYFSPLDSTKSMPGIEFHANMLDSLLQGKYLAPLSNASVWVGMIVFSLLLIVSFYFFSTQVSVAILCLYSIGIILGGRTLLQYGIFVNIFPFFLLGGSVFLISYVYKFFITNKDRRYIEHAFSHYIAPEIVHRIAEDPESFRLGGENREITIFFSDIASFTTISEKLGTERIFSLLEEYLSEMTDILIRNKGTLDKYIGDAVMGFFNAPLSIERPEYWACKTALEQQEKITELNKKWVQEGIPNIAARVGIDTGEAMVGNIGSRNRFNYTVIGDHVNLASRLE